ncbi:hypothetical protein COCSADRAFT_177484 [Bipolaris sorokiniana ND90Pr]|uniref:Uncharacterized protein n=1 Tax=Cochliobolus sativus (strain ND90Pr / ATCC 201652) TaxID=665912 RepID=M2T5T4_COCSN|nr:uncharacterized protein COCSADRAFT_177484 [Bipolaris sorokiniana ND90Pr]EMD69800.1 hypothetical protein COCSADRAFT_177484 [Bipolaris sorokiniana ND90Pr]
MSLVFQNKKPRKQYVLGDFVKYATGTFAAHFVAISNMGLYEFAEKRYMDENNNHKLVIWFCYIGGTINNGDTVRGMTQERKFQRAVVEFAIHFIFLVSGRLNQTLDITNPDLLGHFKLALVNLLRNREAHEAAHHTPTKRLATRVEETAITKNEARPFKVSETRYENSTSEIIRRPLPPIVAASLNRRVIDLTRDVPGSSPQVLNERVILEQQVRDLRAKLEEEKVKTNALEARLVREKAIRQRLRDQRERWTIQRQALKVKVAAKRQRLAQCKATALEYQLQIAAVKEELGCEKKARMFWQHKHNSLPRMLLDRSRLAVTSGASNDQESSVVLVRIPNAGVHKGSFGSGRSQPL